MQTILLMINTLSPKIIKRFVAPQTTTDGAGVRLKRTIGTALFPDLDPFLLLDHFGSDRPEDYIAGFPIHPHRGIETVTYMLEGKIRHSDSAGNSGVIESGGVQWMTAGSGIMHEEMPERTEGRLDGFQLWVNLPAAEKMTRPRYQEFKGTEIPLVPDDSGSEVRVIAGSFRNTAGPVDGLAGAPTFFDVKGLAGKTIRFDLRSVSTAFCYLYKGSATFGSDGEEEKEVGAPLLVVFEEDAELLDIRIGRQGAAFLFVAGNPLNEPVSRYGPFVMNTREEIDTALDELRRGTFIKEYGN